MNVYDFDKTIYRGDSSIDFYKYCLRQQPSLLLMLPKQALEFIRYKTHKINTQEFKQLFFSFLTKIENIDLKIDNFWACHKNRIKKWYLEQLKSDDLIISASPSFLIEPICKILNIQNPITTDMNKFTGKITGNNCKGAEKVRRYNAIYPNTEIQSFYSDSLSDTPLAQIAQNAYIVKGDKIQKWNQK